MVIMFPHRSGKGGPGSFQTRFEFELKRRGWVIKYNEYSKDCNVVFIVGGTKKILKLLYYKLIGTPIVFRLDGINWIHRKRETKRGLSIVLKSEVDNMLMNFIHSFLADRIVYQSEFVRKWWQRIAWIKKRDYHVIYNSVNLKKYLPAEKVGKNIKVVFLEGYLDYTPYAIRLINDIHERLRDKINIEVYGGIFFTKERELLNKEISYFGPLMSDSVPLVLQNSIYVSLDINPACPNTVVEALACGAPVVGFDTGALKELVPKEAGKIVPFGSDPWEIGYPDVEKLTLAILEVHERWADYSVAARRVSEKMYDIDVMTNLYLKVINDTFKLS